MTALFDDFEAFKRKVSQLEALTHQTRGAYKETMGRLKKEFGCKTLKDAKKKLGQMQRKELALAKTYIQQRKQFEKKIDSIRDKIRCQSKELNLLLNNLLASTPRLLKPARKKWKP